MKTKCKNCEDIQNGSIIIHDEEGRCKDCKKFISFPIDIPHDKDARRIVCIRTGELVPKKSSYLTSLVNYERIVLHYFMVDETEN